MPAMPSSPTRTVVPPPLRAGDVVAVVAPAGPVRDRPALVRGMERLRSWGLEPRAMPGLDATDGYFAGPDAVRAADLQAAIDDPDVRGILCARGGYGTMRTLEHVDLTGLGRDPKVILGYSDITVLLAAAWTEHGLVGLHGPMIAAPEHHASGPACTDQQRRLLMDGLGDAPFPPLEAPDVATVVRSGNAEGPLVGGNLALVAALLGTPWQIDTAGAVLFLEDVDEPSYRVDRMLTQLRLAGCFDACAGVILGDFTPPGSRGPDDPDDPRVRAAIDAVLDERLGDFEFPVVRGLPFGHRARSWTLPFGARARLSADGERFELRLALGSA